MLAMFEVKEVKMTFQFIFLICWFSGFLRVKPGQLFPERDDTADDDQRRRLRFFGLRDAG